jgi:hypothetical protein
MSASLLSAPALSVNGSSVGENPFEFAEQERRGSSPNPAIAGRSGAISALSPRRRDSRFCPADRRLFFPAQCIEGAEKQKQKNLDLPAREWTPHLDPD